MCSEQSKYLPASISLETKLRLLIIFFQYLQRLYAYERLILPSDAISWYLTDSIFMDLKSPWVGGAGLGGLLDSEEESRSSPSLLLWSCPSGMERNRNFGMWSGR